METVKGPVVIPPQEPVRPDTGTPPDPQKADTGTDPYIPPVEQQDDAQGAGSEVSDGEDA